MLKSLKNMWGQNEEEDLSEDPSFKDSSEEDSSEEDTSEEDSSEEDSSEETESSGVGDSSSDEDEYDGPETLGDPWASLPPALRGDYVKKSPKAKFDWQNVPLDMRLAVAKQGFPYIKDEDIPLPPNAGRREYPGDDGGDYGPRWMQWEQYGSKQAASKAKLEAALRRLKKEQLREQLNLAVKKASKDRRKYYW